MLQGRRSPVEGDAFYSETHEGWLGFVASLWRPRFERAGRPLPPRLHVSFGRAAHGISTGVCYAGEASGDGAPHIFIPPSH
jgi:hypothetical protein